MSDKYVILNRSDDISTNNYVGIDTSSGGYPYITEIYYAKIWPSKEMALEYCKIFPKENWEVMELIMYAVKAK